MCNRGGESIQIESRKYVRTYGAINIGDVVCADPGYLNCFHLLHAVGEQYNYIL